MRNVIAVGQDTSNNCLVVKFNGATWAVISSFPTINGKLWGCFYYSDSDYWVCGGTGNGGQTAPILYHYKNGSWVNHSSDFSDALWLYSIDGNSSSNIYVSGETTSNVGGVWHYTGTWTSTIVNTDFALGFPNAGGQFPHLAVDSSGYAYTSNWTTVSSNKASSTWALFYTTAGSQAVQIRHAGSSNLIIPCNNTLKPVEKYNGTVWAYDGTVGHTTVCVGVKTFTQYCYYLLADTKVYESVGGVTTAISTAAYFSNANRYIYSDDDLWTCGPLYANGTWDTVPQLSIFESGTTWSGPTDYNVNGLSAAVWCDIKSVIEELQLPLRCTAEYIDSDFVLNHYICNPSQRKAIDGQRVVVAPFSIANPSIKIRRK